MSRTTLDAATVRALIAEHPDRSGEVRFLIHDLDWEEYDHLVEELESRGIRLTYLKGTLEVLSPGPIHEQWEYVLGRAVSDLIIGLGTPAKGQGSTTIRNQLSERGLEADECFYLASLPLLRGKDLAQLKPFPPPDLAIEVEQTAPLLPKLQVYAGLGVPEVWWHRDGHLGVLRLGDDGQYAESEQSRAFPFLPLDRFRERLATFDPDDETGWFQRYRVWVQDEVAPLYHP